MHYTFYGIKNYIRWEFRKRDILKDINYYIPHYSTYDEEPRIRNHIYKQEEVIVFEETTDFDYTSVRQVEHDGNKYNIISVYKIAFEDEIKVYIDYTDGISEGMEDATKCEEEYKKNKSSDKKIIKQNWFKKLFKIKS